MSVLSRSSMSLPQIARTRNARRSDAGNRKRGDGEGLLAVAPGQVLDQQQADAAQHMHRQQEHQPGLGELHERACGPLQEAVEARLAVDGEPKGQKVQRQKAGERQPREPMHHGRDPQRIAAMAADVLSRAWAHSTTAETARRPSAASTTPNIHIRASS